MSYAEPSISSWQVQISQRVPQSLAMPDIPPAAWLNGQLQGGLASHCQEYAFLPQSLAQ